MILNKEGDAGTQNKVKALEKQYNDLLVSAVSEYAEECIEAALEGSEGTFGENVEEILDTAFAELKTKVLADLGLDATTDMVGYDAEGEEDMAYGGEGDFEAGAEGGEEEEGVGPEGGSVVLDLGSMS
jgi:hypothetical protein